MKHFKFVAAICCLGFLALTITARVEAQTTNEKTIMTFSEPFEVPGVWGSDPSRRHLCLYTRGLAFRPEHRQNHKRRRNTCLYHHPRHRQFRLKPTDETVLTFKERGEGQPEAIKAWFYPGYAWGQEFVYPKKRAIELAKIANEPVLEMPVETTTAVPVETLKSVPVAAIQPTGEEVPVTAVVQTPPAAVAAAPPATEVAQALPHTASSLPLFALIGMLSLFAGFTLLVIAKRTV